MKSIIFLIFLFSFVIANAQTSETISELTPVPSNVGKFSGRLPGKKLKFDVKVEFINLPDKKNGIALTIQTHYNELIFESIGGKPTSRLSVYGRIISNDKKIDGFFEEKITTSIEIDDLIDTRGKFVTLRKVFELPDGKYQTGIIVRDLLSSYDLSYHGDSLDSGTSFLKRGIKIIKFRIPQSAKK